MEGKAIVASPKKERPVGVAVAAVLLVLSSGVGLLLRVLGELDDPLAVAWIALHLCILITAIGLWRLKAWAFWAWVTMATLSVVLSLGRFVAGEVLGIYAALRICAIGLWILYFFRPHVRAAFRDAA